MDKKTMKVEGKNNNKNSSNKHNDKENDNNNDGEAKENVTNLVMEKRARREFEDATKTLEKQKNKFVAQNLKTKTTINGAEEIQSEKAVASRTIGDDEAEEKQEEQEEKEEQEQDHTQDQDLQQQYEHINSNKSNDTNETDVCKVAKTQSMTIVLQRIDEGNDAAQHVETPRTQDTWMTEKDDGPCTLRSG